MGIEKDSCKLRPEATARFDISNLFGPGNLIFIRENTGKSH